MGKIKFINIIGGLVLATLAVGCASNTKSLGTVGNVQFYRVKSSTFSGPNFSALVAEKDGNVAVVETFGGPGLGATVISSIGQVGASAVLGTSFPRIPRNVGDNITVTGGNANAQNANQSSSTASSSATGGSSSATGASHTHPASPGNGGVPGNGGPNGNGGNNGNGNGHGP